MCFTSVFCSLAFLISPPSISIHSFPFFLFNFLNSLQISFPLFPLRALSFPLRHFLFLHFFFLCCLLLQIGPPSSLFILFHFLFVINLFPFSIFFFLYSHYKLVNPFVCHFLLFTLRHFLFPIFCFLVIYMSPPLSFYFILCHARFVNYCFTCSILPVYISHLSSVSYSVSLHLRHFLFPIFYSLMFYISPPTLSFASSSIFFSFFPLINFPLSCC